MTERSFVDTNVLLYSVLPLPGEMGKARIADAVLDSGAVCFSVQVFQEFYVQATRSTRVNRLDHEEAVGLIRSWKRHPVQAQTVDLMDHSLEAKRRWSLSYWDAAIIEAARLMGCRTVLSEDMADGRDYAGVRVVNPFAGDPPPR